MKQIFNAEKIAQKDVVNNVRRPLFVEVPLGKFAFGGLPLEVNNENL